MDQLASLRFDVWTDGTHEMCAIRADVKEGQPGLRWVWFVLTREELCLVAQGRQTTAEDGYHHLTVWGDCWTFYDLEMPSGNAGEMRCPYRRVTMPRLFIKAIYRLARKTWELQRKYQSETSRGDKVSIEISAEHRARIVRLYGCGKGAVRWELDGTTRAMLGHHRAAGGSRLADMLDRIETIARNTTRGFHETASVQISKDCDGFFWRACRPGRSKACTMNGGLVNHGRDGAHDWRIHT